MMCSKNRLLITGYRSGLGAYLYCHPVLQKQFNIHGLARSNNICDIANIKYDVIVHCARTNILLDDINITKQILEHTQCRKFVFLSSLDVKQGIIEEYGASKLASESLIRNISANHLIIRPGTLCHRYMKKNSIVKLLQNETVTITKDSVFHLVDANSIALTIANHESFTGLLEMGANAVLAADINPDFTNKWGSYKYICPPPVGLNLEYQQPYDIINNIRSYLNE